MRICRVERSPSHSIWLLALFAGVGVTLLFRLGDAPSYTAAEWRCRQVVTSMISTGDLLVPRIDGAPHLTKPPLYYWHAVFWSRLFDHAGRFQHRFPSVLSALGLVGLAYLWGRSAGGSSLGLLSAACLAGMNLLYSRGRQGTFDSQLAFFCVAALLTADRYRTTRRPAWIPLFALLVVLAFLTKGPPAFMFIGLPILLYLLERRRLGVLLNRHVWPWLLLILPLSLAWFVVILMRVPQAREILLSEAVLPVGVEIGKTTAKHYKWPLFFLERSPSILFPALLLLPAVVWQAWRSRGWPKNRSLRLAFWAVLGPLVFLSIIPQKQVHFFFPLLVPLSVLYGKALMEIVSTSEASAWLYIPVPVFGAICWIMAALVVFFEAQIIPETPWLWGSCLVVLIGAGFVLLFGGRRRPGTSFLSVGLLATWAMFLCFYGSLNVWDLQFKHGTVFDRPEYHAEQWADNFQKYPWLQEIFREKYHGERVIETP